MPNTTTWNRDDRDLLVELRTEMLGVRADLQDLKGNWTSRLLNLEGNAVSKIQLESTEDRFKRQAGDHEDRIRKMEKYQWIQTGAAAAAASGITQLVNLMAHVIK